ncbi:uncharacterized protein E5676_scaffold455G008390 [Cucumis melo var. makuwa]|uniref:Uncharacterized protein n=1 Tax=Cucumis melo var. makuwa TaxID=1194695 RepID=A0A5D3E6R6_CUCMM|nr:uncharacterized protein E6C27_scaffold205G00750 [Cucumis melo var. makuwa]TYK31518.1 uncharacterized protein E5676_scaffold455G008390 [Cucumis melo var. makuwa]
MGEVREKTLRELAEPDEDQRPLCIVIPPTTQPFELKSRLIHLLPIFKGSFGEDSHKHLKDFHMVCDSMRPHGISEEQLNLRAFPFSLTDVVKRWLYYLELGSITTWDETTNDSTYYRHKQDGWESELPAQPDHANVSVISLSGKILDIPTTKEKKVGSKKEGNTQGGRTLGDVRNVQINLPLLDAIQQVPRYAKFLKELCTNKRKTKETAMEIG